MDFVPPHMRYAHILLGRDQAFYLATNKPQPGIRPAFRALSSQQLHAQTNPEQRNLLAFAENATALFNWHDRLPARELTFQPAGNQAFRRALFDELGPWDESLLYLEDFEWSQRVVLSGRKIYFNPAAGSYITGRESLGAIIYKFYTWGLNVREFYLPGRTSQVWLFGDNPRLFWVNAPLRMLNETWVTVKRWFPFYPLKTLLLIPLFLLYRAAWATGIAVGAHRYFKKH